MFESGIAANCENRHKIIVSLHLIVYAKNDILLQKLVTIILDL